MRPSKEDKIRLVSLGVIALPEAALIEAVRQIAFIAGHLSIHVDKDDLLSKAKAGELYSEIGMPVFEAACEEWELTRKD